MPDGGWRCATLALSRPQLGHAVREADRRDACIVDRCTPDPGAGRQRLEMLQVRLGLADEHQAGQRVQRPQLRASGRAHAAPAAGLPRSGRSAGILSRSPARPKHFDTQRNRPEKTRTGPCATILIVFDTLPEGIVR
jgi:hypothetical protein